MKIRAGIIGATGYAGAELVRILLTHPEAEIAAISSVSFEGKKLSEVYPSYKSLCDMECGTQDEVVEKSDVIFAALPHGLSQELAAQCDKAGKAFIDLGQTSVWNPKMNIKEYALNSFYFLQNKYLKYDPLFLQNFSFPTSRNNIRT